MAIEEDEEDDSYGDDGDDSKGDEDDKSRNEQAWRQTGSRSTGHDLPEQPLDIQPSTLHDKPRDDDKMIMMTRTMMVVVTTMILGENCQVMKNRWGVVKSNIP